VITVRALLGTDRPEVLRVNAGQPGVARLADSELRRLCALSSLHLVAEDSDFSLLGYMLAFERNADYDGEEFLKLRSLTPKTYVYIDQIAVASASKGQGIGRALYAAIAGIARGDGSQALCCEVNTVPPNPDSMAFHEALGFRRMGALATSDGREVELLLKDLA
jgi:predicted GNAT superfamily acetyltransferase